ncbi:MAG: Gfo/Idh/MocA family oxidoreductase [Bacteroidales bacterium]|nr:Gfo/Idh/MocA family oxidoreductase [Bacteroidales bacterium]
MEKQIKRMLTRRKFVGTAAAVTAFTIVPKNVLGSNSGSVAPNDKIRLAHIGCGMQGHAELGPLINCPDLQIVAVCDPETDGRNYLNFGNGTSVPTGTLNTIRNLVSNPKWRDGINYVPGGRMVMKEVIETFYANQRAADKFPSVKAYNDFRELLEKEDIDAVKIMTPDHLHATIAIAAMKKGKHVITHKPLANRMYESDLVIKTAKETGVATYFMPFNSYQSSEQIKKMVADGAIGTLKEVHEWSARPMWTQILKCRRICLLYRLVLTGRCGWARFLTVLIALTTLIHYSEDGMISAEDHLLIWVTILCGQSAMPGTLMFLHGLKDLAARVAEHRTSLQVLFQMTFHFLLPKRFAYIIMQKDQEDQLMYTGMTEV